MLTYVIMMTMMMVIKKLIQIDTNHDTEKLSVSCSSIHNCVDIAVLEAKNVCN